MFFFDVLHPDQTRSIEPAEYYFELYRSTLNYTLAGDYSVVLGLTTNGGLRATYFKTIDF